VSFFGNDYLSYNFEDTGNGPFSVEENITLSFKTQRAKALLFYVGDQEVGISFVLMKNYG